MRSVVVLLVGIVIGLLLATVADQPPTLTAQSQSVLFGIHPTTGARIPISVTAEGYINTKVIP